MKPWLAWIIALVLIVLGAGAHVAYLIFDCPIDLSGDEAHYWEWSRRLDISYYSKGPLVAYIIAAGRWIIGPFSQAWLGNDELAVRLPAVALSALTMLGVFQLARMTIRRDGVALGSLGVLFTVPILVAGSMLMTIDSPLAACWVWCAVAVFQAMRTDHLRWWLIAGFVAAVGLLAKYNMVLMFAAMIFFAAAERDARRFVLRPGPYLMGAISLLGLLPIVVWNARHNWVSFRHVAGQAGVADEATIRLQGVIDYLAGQLGVVTPVWLGLMIAGAVLALRGRYFTPPVSELEETNVADEARSRSAIDSSQRRFGLRYLACLTLTPWLFFLAFSPITKVQPNWPVLGTLSGAILAVVLLSEMSRHVSTRRAAMVLLIAAAVPGAILSLAGHRTDLLMPLIAAYAGKPPPWNPAHYGDYDPAIRVRGWQELGEAVGRVRATEIAAGRDPLIFCDQYQLASLVAFYTPENPPVYCVQVALGNRRSQYDLWRPNPIADPIEFKSRPVIYVGSLEPEIAGDRTGAGAALVGLKGAEHVEIRVGGYLVRQWTVFRAEGFAGFSEAALQQGAKY
jgi:4-amino-4-deoxy-L-arabinose transferase-like glycosyltransferase